MANSEGFVSFVLDQLESLDVTVRKMFGEAGLYSGSVFFGILAGDVLYLRVGDSNRSAFERARSTPFRPFEDGRASKKYFSVPVSVLESPNDLVKWSRAAIAEAQAGSATRPAAAPASRRRPPKSTAASSRGRTRR